MDQTASAYKGILWHALNKTVHWSSSNETIATVSDGLIIGVASGIAVITVTTQDGNKQAHCIVTVNIPVVPVTGVTLNKPSTTLTVGAYEQLTATVLPLNASNKNISWSSSNNAIAGVVDGIVIGAAQGTATITVTTQDGNRQANCIVTVTPSADIYAVLSHGGRFSVWKNGTLYLSGFGDIKSYFVSGNDVYLAGSESDGHESYATATLWKNGVPQRLPYGDRVSLYEVCVIDNDIYVSAWEFSEGYPFLWKNGVPQYLPDGYDGGGGRLLFSVPK